MTTTDDDGRTDGRTPDTCIYFKLTYEHSAQVSYQLKDIKIQILLFLLHLRISNQSIFESDITTNMQFSKVQNAIYFKGHWLRYSTTPSVTTLFSEKSQAMNFAFIFLLHT